MKLKKYRKIFNDHEFIGSILIRFSVLEQCLDYALIQYFIRDDKYPELDFISKFHFC